jgi:hypothetical protein
MKLKQQIYSALCGLSLIFLPISGHAYPACEDNCSTSKWLFSEWDFAGDIEVSAGYRLDQLKSNVNIFSAPGVFEGSDNLKVRNLSIYEIGAKGRVTFFDFYLRGFGYWGWGNNGHYSERVSDASETLVSLSKARVHSSRSQDTLGGIGYLFNFCDCCNNEWGLGPVVGWSYAYQRVKLKNGRTNDIPDRTFDGLVYKNRWSGPWIGVDFTFQHCHFRFNAGYEYHWAHWHADWELNGPNVTPVAFSDSRNSKHAYGNVLYFDGFWNFAGNWELGLGFRLQEWRARKGHLKPKAGLAAVGLPPTEVDRVKLSTWCSGEVTIDLGYTF